MNENTKARLWLITAIVFGAALLRLIPHPPNFTPLGALALFAGARYGRKSLAFVLPLAAMLMSDTLLEITTGWGFHSTLPAVYLTLALIVPIGFLIRKKGIGVGTVAGGSIVASTIFFALTNLAVWATSGMYPLTLSGLVTCYVAAIPFFGNTVAGDLFFSGVLFGSFAVAERKIPAFAPAGTESI
ncbi:MAG: DUF6580 family putative transport protein [Thermoanaerobaculia bacterium]|nr:DUF6580 family putative transport protein [Thermoanaerobaculia bacterium]